MAVVPVNGHIHVTRGGAKRWGTDEPPIQLVGYQAIPITFEFSDFAKDIAYDFQIYTQQPANITRQYGMSVVKMLPQETVFPDVTVGSVPPGCNYADFRVMLQWTVVPSQCMGYPVMSPIRRGRVTDLRGGSAIIELSGNFRRQIDLKIVNGSIVLSRKQSTRNSQEGVGWAAGNQVFNANGGPREGWTYGTSILGNFVNLIDRKVDGANVHRGGSNGASLVDNTNYYSRWEGTLFVRPGRYNASI